MRLAFVGGVVAAAFGGITPPCRAEDVSTRDEVVAREAPGKAEAGIAVLRGNERVQLLRDRDGWSEILLGDGRHAWVPTVELVRAETAKPASSPTAATTPEAEAHAPVPDVQASLVVEIARLRAVVDDLETRRRLEPAATAPATTPEAERVVLAAAAAFVVGLLLGTAWQRRRTRRERALRF